MDKNARECIGFIHFIVVYGHPIEIIHEARSEKCVYVRSDTKLYYTDGTRDYTHIKNTNAHESTTIIRITLYIYEL